MTVLKLHSKRLVSQIFRNRGLKHLVLFGQLGLMANCKTRNNQVELADLSVISVSDVALPQRDYDPDLEVFVLEFVSAAKKRGVVINEEIIQRLRVVKYVDAFSSGESDSAVMAVCNRYLVVDEGVFGSGTSRWMVIEVLKGAALRYTQSDQIRLRELLFHELFHCLLNKGHLPPGKPGIMSATFTPGSTRAFDDWEGLVDEMFSKEYLDLIPDAET